MLTADVNRLGYIGRKPGAVPADRDADSWYTPASYIEAARAVMDGIDLDQYLDAIVKEWGAEVVKQWIKEWLR